MNNPFGLPDELFGAILASAITEGMNTASSRSMKKPNPAAPKTGCTAGRWCNCCKENL